MPSPADIVETLSEDDKRALVNFTPGIWDAAWIFERNILLAARGLLRVDDEDGRKFHWTDSGQNVRFAIQNPEAHWFWRDACKAWLHEDNTIHAEGEHQ